MNKPQSDAPLFDLFWENSSLNRTRAILLAQKIALDSATPYVPPRPRYTHAASPLIRSQPDSSRRSKRDFAHQALTTEHLSELFFPFSNMVDEERRQLASAGAKYPLLVYAHLLNTDHLHQGQTVWYDPQTHGLTAVHPCPPWETLKVVLGVDDWTTQPAMVIGICADSQGMLHKYGERGGRFLLLEAGMYIGALYQQCTHLELAGIALGSYYDQDCLSTFAHPTNYQLMSIFACGIPQTINPR